MSKNKGFKMGKLTVLLLIVFVGVFAFSAYKLFSMERVYQEGEATYEAIAQAALTTPQTVEQQPEAKPAAPVPSVEPVQPEQLPEEEPEPVYVPLLDVDFATLLEMNEDTVAWLHMAGALDYPVVQGEDNEFYIRHMFDGTYNWNGSIFMDTRSESDFSGRNTYIYGHNMGNGTMFAVLLKYSTPGFYEEHRELIVVTPEASYYLQPFSGYTTSTTSGTYRWDFESDEAFASYLQDLYSWSEFTSDVEVTAQDRIVTLSTCSYAFNNARYVLHCKLVPAGQAG